MIKCKVTVKQEDGQVHQYEGRYPSTFDAVIDALDKFGIVKVSVEVLSREQ